MQNNLQRKNGKETLSLKGVIFSAIILSFFFFSFTSAADTIINNGPEGLQIFYPDFSFVKQNAEFGLHIHVSNISNGVQLPNADVDCYLHLYNSSGSHTFESGVLGKDVNGVDHEIYLYNNGGNFSDLGPHAFYIWCYYADADLGGEARGTFEVIPSEFNITTQLYLIILILSFGIIVFGFAIQDNWVIVLGGFATIVLGLFTLFYGIAEFRDETYTWAISIITLMLGAYFSVRGSMEALS